MVRAPSFGHEVQGLNTAGGGIQLMPVQHFIAQILSLSPFHCPDLNTPKPHYNTTVGVQRINHVS